MSKSKTYNFFATQADLVPVLRAVESEYPLKYVRTGLFDEPEQAATYGFLSLPNLGYAETGDTNFEPTFLVMRHEATFRVTAVPQRRGGTKYAVDQKGNPATVVFRPGGKFRDAAVVAGMVGSANTDVVAATLLKAFSRALKGHFTSVKSYLVGSEAKKLLDSGVRLTKNVKAPHDFDLAA